MNNTEIMPATRSQRFRIIRSADGERGRREGRDLATRTRSRSPEFPDITEDGDELMEEDDRGQEQMLVASSLRQIVAVGDARSLG